MKKLSPHVTIYKFPITALSSITNRVTGLFISGTFVGIGSLYFFNKEAILYDSYKNSSDFTKKAMHTICAFPVAYHTLGGIRHLVWDAKPHLLTNSGARNSSIALIISSVCISIMAGTKIRLDNT